MLRCYLSNYRIEKKCLENFVTYFFLLLLKYDKWLMIIWWQVIIIAQIIITTIMIRNHYNERLFSSTEIWWSNGSHAKWRDIERCLKRLLESNESFSVKSVNNKICCMAWNAMVCNNFHPLTAAISKDLQIVWRPLKWTFRLDMIDFKSIEKLTKNQRNNGINEYGNTPLFAFKIIFFFLLHI